MSWTNHLDSRAARVSRIEYRWRLRRKMRRAGVAASAAASCAHNIPPATVAPPRGQVEDAGELRNTCLESVGTGKKRVNGLLPAIPPSL